MGLKKTLKKNIIKLRLLHLSRPYLEKKFWRPPIVIGGSMRSGTTLLLSILGAHPHVFSIKDETEALCPTAFSKNVDLNAPFVIDKLYWYLLLNKVPRSCVRWCEKTPKNVLFFRRILDYFKNNVKIVHVVRDGRDVVISRHPGAPSRFWVSPSEWVADVTMGLQFENHPGVLTIKYEDIVLHTKDTLIQVCNFLEEEFYEKLLSYEKHTIVRQNRAWQDEAQPIYSNSINKWKNPEFEERINELMSNEKAVALLKYFKYL